MVDKFSGGDIMTYWIGQAFGILATISGIVIPVFNKKWQMLIMSITTNVLCALNLVFIGEVGSGIFLFAAASVQALVNIIHSRHNREPKLWENILFLIIYLAVGFYGLVSKEGYVPGVNPQNLLEMMPIIAVVLNMLFVSSSREKTARMFFISCNVVWTAYYIIILSTSGFGSGFAVVSGLIALIREKRKYRV